jgi:hypothetical protein
MRGCITEKDFAQCEDAFPGIVRFYEQLVEKPRTFLELVFAYERRAVASSSRRGSN